MNEEDFSEYQQRVTNAVIDYAIAKIKRHTVPDHDVRTAFEALIAAVRRDERARCNHAEVSAVRCQFLMSGVAMHDARKGEPVDVVVKVVDGR